MNWAVLYFVGKLTAYWRDEDPLLSSQFFAFVDSGRIFRVRRRLFLSQVSLALRGVFGSKFPYRYRNRFRLVLTVKFPPR